MFSIQSVCFDYFSKKNKNSYWFLDVQNWNSYENFKNKHKCTPYILDFYS